MNLTQIASLFSQKSPVDTVITGICIDSRSLNAGDLFVAISGEQFDGHDFVHEAQKRGAAAVVVSRAIEGVTIPQFVVADTVEALAKIATAHRLTITCPVIALTGSNGKTTVKEMIASILPAPSHATKGNFNNHIGAPLSVLQLTNQHHYAVFELGANHLGEIAHTVAIVRPDVTLINNIAPAHIEGFGSIEGVARAKGEIHQGLSATGTAIINDDDAFAHFWDDILANHKVLRFSATHSADISIKNLTFDAQGCGHFSLLFPHDTVDIDLVVPGEHQILNALAAASATYAAGADIDAIQKGLNQFGGVNGRMTFLAGKNGAVVIDDTYNANLRSVLTALDVLAKRPGKKIVVFGDMGELGVWSESHHRDVGEAARRLGIDVLMSCGMYSVFASEAFGSGGKHFPSQDEIVQHLLHEMKDDTTILVKGSRSSAMEKIVRQLLN